MQTTATLATSLSLAPVRTIGVATSVYTDRALKLEDMPSTYLDKETTLPAHKSPHRELLSFFAVLEEQARLIAYNPHATDLQKATAYQLMFAIDLSGHLQWWVKVEDHKRSQEQQTKEPPSDHIMQDAGAVAVAVFQEEKKTLRALKNDAEMIVRQVMLYAKDILDLEKHYDFKITDDVKSLHVLRKLSEDLNWFKAIRDFNENFIPLMQELINSNQHESYYQATQVAWPHGAKLEDHLFRTGYRRIYMKLVSDTCVCNICKIEMKAWRPWHNPWFFHDFTKAHPRLIAPPGTFRLKYREFLNKVVVTEANKNLLSTVSPEHLSAIAEVLYRLDREQLLTGDQGQKNYELVLKQADLAAEIAEAFYILQRANIFYESNLAQAQSNFFALMRDPSAILKSLKTQWLQLDSEESVTEEIKIMKLSSPTEQQKNFNKLIAQITHTQGIAPLISFVRANRDNPHNRSILSLMKTIVDFTGMPSSKVVVTPLPPPRIVYAIIDFSTCIRDSEYQQAIGRYLHLSLRDKVAYIKNKMIETYNALKRIHSSAHILITMRECAIGPASDSVDLANNIMTSAEKDFVLTELKALTLDRALTIIPGTLVYAEPHTNLETVVYNRAFVLSRHTCSTETVFQGKSKFLPIELEGCKLHNPRPERDRINNIIELQIADLRLRILIDICLDHYWNTGPEEVDVHFVLSNSTAMKESMLRGKLNIHCDGNRPPSFITDENNHKIHVYITSLVMPDFQIYRLDKKQCDNQKSVGSYYDCPEQEEKSEERRMYEFNDIYKPSMIPIFTPVSTIDRSVKKLPLTERLKRRR